MGVIVSGCHFIEKFNHQRKSAMDLISMGAFLTWGFVKMGDMVVRQEELTRSKHPEFKTTALPLAVYSLGDNLTPLRNTSRKLTL